MGGNEGFDDSALSTQAHPLAWAKRNLIVALRATWGRAMRVERESCSFYTPCYCEENVWKLFERLARDEDEWYAVVISNPSRTAVVLEQRAGSAENGGLVIWDYHVIAFRAIGGKADLVLDLDTRLSFPTPASTYFSRTFLPLDLLRQQFGEVFLKVVEAKQYVREFSSDRSHMRLPDGRWQSPPPDYPCILAPDGVGRFEEQMSITSEDVARRREARGWGTVLTLEEFRDRFL